MTAPPLLEIRGLSRDYVSKPMFQPRHVLKALDDVSLTMQAGEICGVVGESGSGKSTLARLVMALDHPSAGQVLFEGDDLFALSRDALRRRRRDFQMVFQDPFGSLDPRQTVARIVTEPLGVLASPPGRREARALAAAMLASVGVGDDALDRHPHAFSGGQRQRIAIARALITSPKLLVADEAVSALDLSVQAQVLNLILDLRDQRGVAVLFISHNLAVIDSIADRVAVMYRGRIVEAGPAQAVLRGPMHPYTRLLSRSEPSISRLGPPSRMTTTTGSPRSDHDTGGCSFRGRCFLASPRCAHERPTLRPVGASQHSACHHAEALQDSGI